MCTWLINRSFRSPGTILMGERPTVCAFLQAADVGSWSSGAAAAAAVAALAQWPQDLSVSRSGVWCQAFCMYSHTHVSLTHCRKANTITPPTLHWWHIIKIILPPSLCFHHVVSQDAVAPPHVCTHTFSISLSCPLWLPYSESPMFLYRIFLKTMHSLIDVYGNEEVASSKETPYGWEQHTDEKHLQKALVNSWHA